MNAPITDPVWQPFANPSAVVAGVFAMSQVLRHCFPAGQKQNFFGARTDDPSLTPSLRSGPSQAGPTPSAGRNGADRMGAARICFEIRDIAVESSAITTNQRGSFPCASHLSFSPYFPLRSLAACRTPRRAGWPVPLRAPLWPMLSMKTSSPAPQSVALPVLQLAVSNWACRPATPATDPHLDLAACGRPTPPIRTIRADRPGGPLLFTT